MSRSVISEQCQPLFPFRRDLIYHVLLLQQICSGNLFTCFTFIIKRAFNLHPLHYQFRIFFDINVFTNINQLSEMRFVQNKRWYTGDWFGMESIRLEQHVLYTRYIRYSQTEGDKCLIVQLKCTHFLLWTCVSSLTQNHQRWIWMHMMRETHIVCCGVCDFFLEKRRFNCPMHLFRYVYTGDDIFKRTSINETFLYASWGC